MHPASRLHDAGMDARVAIPDEDLLANRVQLPSCRAFCRAQVVEAMRVQRASIPASPEDHHRHDHVGRASRHVDRDAAGEVVRLEFLQRLAPQRHESLARHRFRCRAAQVPIVGVQAVGQALPQPVPVLQVEADRESRDQVLQRLYGVHRERLRGADGIRTRFRGAAPRRAAEGRSEGRFQGTPWTRSGWDAHPGSALHRQMEPGRRLDIGRIRETIRKRPPIAVSAGIDAAPGW